MVGSHRRAIDVNSAPVKSYAFPLGPQLVKASGLLALKRLSELRNNSHFLSLLLGGECVREDGSLITTFSLLDEYVLFVIFLSCSSNSCTTEKGDKQFPKSKHQPCRRSTGVASDPFSLAHRD